MAATAILQRLRQKAQRHEAMNTAAPFKNVGVVGAGSWGTALAVLLDGNNLSTTVWGHEAETIAEIQTYGENRTYLPGVSLPPSLRFTSELAELREAGLLLVVTPSKAIREIAARLSATGLSPDTVLLSCTKGVERGSGSRMSEILREFFPRNPVAVLSGPSHAEEVARRMPTAVVLGCAETAIAHRLQQAFSSRSFRAYTHDDVPGIELGGALKNIFAIAAGVGDGLGLGDNSKAALVTRSLAELVRLGTALGGHRETFQGLSGIGDLIVTCFSRHSRNRLVGERLGRGESLGEITASMQMVAEGVPTTYSAWECARKHGIETPIIDQIRALLDGTVSAREAMERLLARDPKPEV
jgi:glycerol-3-phosphate dehydrogenase (NAD(P)+)